MKVARGWVIGGRHSRSYWLGLSWAHSLGEGVSTEWAQVKPHHSDTATMPSLDLICYLVSKPELAL